MLAPLYIRALEGGGGEVNRDFQEVIARKLD